MRSSLSLKLDLAQAEKLEGQDKLHTLYQVREGIVAIERHACFNPGFPLREIQDARDLIPKVECGIRRLENARRKHDSRKKSFR